MRNKTQKEKTVEKKKQEETKTVENYLQNQTKKEQLFIKNDKLLQRQEKTETQKRTKKHINIKRKENDS